MGEQSFFSRSRPSVSGSDGKRLQKSRNDTKEENTPQVTKETTHDATRQTFQRVDNSVETSSGKDKAEDRLLAKLRATRIGDATDTSPAKIASQAREDTFGIRIDISTKNTALSPEIEATPPIEPSVIEHHPDTSFIQRPVDANSIIAAESIASGSYMENREYAASVTDSMLSSSTDNSLLDHDTEGRTRSDIPIRRELKNLPSIQERTQKINEMRAWNESSKSIIDELGDTYQDNIHVRKLIMYVERAQTKLDALELDLVKTPDERSDEIRKWKYKKRMDTTTKGGNPLKRVINIFHSKPDSSSESSDTRLQEDHKSQDSFESAERTPLKDQEFPGRNWKDKNIKTLSGQIQECNYLLDSLWSAKENADTYGRYGQKHTPFEHTCINGIADAVYNYSGNNEVNYTRQRLLRPDSTFMGKSARQRIREENTLVKQDLRLRTRVGEDGIDESKAHETARECMRDLSTPTLKKMLRLVSQEAGFRDLEQKHGESPQIRKGKLTLFERNAKEHEAFGISDPQLQVIKEELKMELASREDAKKFSTFLGDIKPGASQYIQSVKDLKWLRQVRGKTPEKNRSITTALEKTVIHQHNELDPQSSTTANGQGNPINDSEFASRAKARMVMNMNAKHEAFMWEHFNRGAKTTGENAKELQQDGVNLLNSLGSDDIQLLYQRHRYHTDRLEIAYDNASSYYDSKKIEVSLLEEESKNLGKSYRPSEIKKRRDKSNELKDQKRLLQSAEEERDRKEKEMKAYNSCISSFNGLVLQSQHKEIVTFSDSGQLMP